MLSGGCMDIIKALQREEAKLEKNVKNAVKHLGIVRATMKFFGGSAKPRLAGRKKRRMSAAGRLAISKATKARWAKFHAAKAKPRRKMSAAGRASIVKAQRARWAEIRAVKEKAT
jgi:hypothetical protein